MARRRAGSGSEVLDDVEVEVELGAGSLPEGQEVDLRGFWGSETETRERAAAWS